jgi:hypothetical protein
MLKRTKLGLQHALSVQYDGLRLSSSSYDAGHRGEAVRMANAMFVLLGPSMRNHKSIVNQLEQSGTFKMISTADPRGPHGSALVAIEAVPYTSEDTGKSGWIIGAIPFGHESLRSGRLISLNEWWGEGVLRGAGASETLTRLQVVRVMRNQDGGAHLDDHIKDKTYLTVQIRGVGFQYKPSADSEEVMPVEGALEATIRQMSYEVLQALKSLVISAQVNLSHAATKGPLNTQFFKNESDRVTTGEPEGEN